MLVLEMMVVAGLGDVGAALLEEVEKCVALVASLLEVVAEESRGSSHDSERKPFQLKKTNGKDVK